MTPRFRSLAAMFAILAALAGLSLYLGHAYRLDVPLRMATTAMVAPSHPTRPEGKYGWPSEPWKFRQGYVIAQPGHFTPWAAECLSMTKLAGHAKRTDDFRPDPDVPQEFRATLNDYLGSDYDRGHMAPAADNKFSQAAMSESFFLDNMLPQVPELNRGSWAQLERNIRELVTDGKTTVYVFTGPAFVPDATGTITVETIGSHVQFVPTHCFKTCLVERDGDVQSLAAWLAPNTDDPGDPGDWRVAVDTLEQVTALDFWAGLPDDLENELEARR